MKVLLFCDGSVRTGGRAGIGVVIASEDGMPLRRFGEALSEPHTVNTAEYVALIRGLEEALKMGATEVECFVDSTLVHGQLVLGWQCNAPHLQELRARVLEMLSRFASWELHRVESEQNRLAHCYASVGSAQNRRRFFRQRPRFRGEHRTPTQKEEHSMKLVLTERHETLPDGVYAVRLLGLTPVQGRYGEQLQWKLEVTSPEHAGATLPAWSNLSADLRGKTARWAAALLGERLTAGDTLDTDRLLGKQARALVTVVETADGRQYNRVTDLLPTKQRATVPADDGDPFEED